jgi:hypothetical protein
MKSPPPYSLDNYQAGARAARARTLGSLALGATALAALPADAGAQITVFTPTGGNVAGAAFYPTDYFSVLTGETNNPDFFPAAEVYVKSVLNADHVEAFLSNNYTTAKFAVVNGTTAFDLENFSAGTQIKGASFGTFGYFKPYNTPVLPAWASTTGYVGFKYTQGDGAHYGWLKFTTNTDGSSVTLDAMGYDTVAGQGITAGEGQAAAVPEPASSALLLACGAAGLAAYRRRKKIQRPA